MYGHWLVFYKNIFQQQYEHLVYAIETTDRVYLKKNAIKLQSKQNSTV